MGSQSDWPTMRHAAETLDALKIDYEARIVSAHRTPDRLYEFADERQGRRLQGHHRRRRRRRAPAGHDRRADHPARVRRAGADPRRSAARTACSRSSRCRPAFRSARSPSARPAPPTPRCSPPPSWRCPIPRSPRALDALPRASRPTPSPQFPSRRCLTHRPLPPGSTIGILGGGQLGRMLALAAARLGMKTHIYLPRSRQPRLRRDAAQDRRRL